MRFSRPFRVCRWRLSRGIAATLVLATLTYVEAASLAAAEIAFRDASEAWGLSFRHRNGNRGDFFMPESMGSGLAIFDYDGDGDNDVLFVDSGTPAPYGEEPSRPRLYRNDGRKFVDVTVAAGVRLDSYGMGVTVGDVDANGSPDIYFTAYGQNRLLLNNGDGTFHDATEESGLGDSSWGASAAFADVDLDSDLDVYVTNYVDFDYDNNVICGLEEQGLRSYCHPDVYGGLPDRLFLNRGDGTFRDATAEAGLGEATGNGLGVVFGDLSGDGWPDLYVANDMTPNFHFRNRGDGSFEEMALMVGTALSDRGEPEAGMGVDMGDLDGNGWPDLMMTHLDQQTNVIYSNTGAGIFIDRRFAWRVAESSLLNVGFGVAFVDLDLDGDLDIVVANGHIIHNVEEWRRGTTYRQRNQVFTNLGNGQFEEVLDSGLDVVRSSRGLAVGDLDGDGDADLLINNSDEEAEVYENVTPDSGRWLRVDLEDPGGANHAVVGARLEITVADRRQTRETRTASSYLSQNESSVLFGLAEALQVDSLRIRWPGNEFRILRSIPPNRRIRVVR